jgi:hypothetical protein
MSRFLCLSISGLLEPAGCALTVADLYVETRTGAAIIPFAPSQRRYNFEGLAPPPSRRAPLIRADAIRLEAPAL